MLRKIYIIIFAVFVLILSLILIAISHVKPDSGPLFFTDPRYAPGAAYFNLSLCNWESIRYSPEISCNAFVNGSDVLIDYSLPTQKIVSTTYEVKDKTIGDFIAKNGGPTAIRKSPYIIRVYWGNDFAWLPTGNFSPDTIVMYYSYELNYDEHVDKWHGFK